MKNHLKNKTGFTLAEILITLLIIGVIASLVIPAIIQDAQDAEYKTAYKKAYAMLANVTKQALANSEFLAKQTWSELDTSQGNFKTLESYFSVSKDCSSANNAQCWDDTGEIFQTGNSFLPRNWEYSFIDNAGMSWSMAQNVQNIILVDTNGFKGPNRYGKDRWLFTFGDMNNNRIDSGLPSKVIPLVNNDVISATGWCHYPPCNFQSWLLP